jgi:FkbM family methyltransferase
MPATQSDHWDYTIEEWQGAQYKALLARIAKDIVVIWDVGANVGGWAHVAKIHFPEAIIHCFEPVEANFEHMKNRLWRDVELHNFGIYYGATESRVVSRGGTNVGAFFLEQVNAGEPRHIHDEVIQLKTFEELPLGEPDLIKLDVEGAEENILEHSSIVKKTPYLLIEWHPNTEPLAFFKQHLPDHRVVASIGNSQYLLAHI